MLFDTSIVIDMLRKKKDYQYGSISTITLLEVIRGTPDTRMAEVLVLLKQMFQVYDIDDNVVLVYSRLYGALKQMRKIVADADLMIISTAHSKNEKLLTKDHGFEVLSNIVDMKIE
ncbi:MAG: type II toxin-antitoxin system VapC family toxin [Candidatus Micrarchaeaceae archaeon]|jgi:predicted nucleic acid-binding protein